MSQFAVLHITKYKALVRIGSHIDRKHAPHHASTAKTDFNEELLETLGRSIDGERSPLNEERSAQKPLLPLREAIEKRIEEGYTQKRALRKDAVKALGVILSGSHERMKQIEAAPRLFEQWKQANFAFAAELFGKENIVRFTLHRDEKTPHFHCVVVPITPEGHLSARHFVNGSHTLKAYQDRYAQAMAPFGLERGLSTSITWAQHQATSQYYKQINQAHEQQRLSSSLAQQRLEAFQGVPHKRSLFYHLGLDATASLQGLRTELKASEKAIIWGLYRGLATPKSTLVSTYTLRLNEQGQFCPYFQKGLPRGLALLDTGHTPERIVITDSPLEALQRRQGLYHSDQKAFKTTLFVSTCGPLSQGLRQELVELVEVSQAKQIAITLCLPREGQSLCEKPLYALSHRFWQGDLCTPWPLTLSQLAGALKALSTEEDRPEEIAQEEATQKPARVARKRG